MKLQDRFPFIVFLIGINRIFHTVGNDSFFINSTCILSENQIITINKSYILFDYPDEVSLKVRPIILKQVSKQGNVLYIRTIDMITNKNVVKHLVLDNSDEECPWVLISPDYFLDKMKGNGIPSQNMEQQSNDLLDFDY